MKNQVLSFLVAAALLACKDDKQIIPDPIPTVEEKAIIPAKDQRYTYKISESDGGESSSVTRVTAVKDSAGIAVYTIENAFPNAEIPLTLRYKAFSKDGFTTNEITSSAGLNAINEYIEEFAIIKESELTGLPQRQVFENKGTVGSKVTFTKQPMRQYMALEIPTEEGAVIAAEIETLITYHDGKVVKEESVTTPAGTFNCSKWEYTYDLETKLSSELFPTEESGVVYTVRVWTAPGVGIVKSEEFSGSDITLTELQKIDK